MMHAAFNRRQGYKVCIPVRIDELSIAIVPLIDCRDSSGIRLRMVEKGGKAGWNKGWDVTRMIVVDLGVKSAIQLCDSRTRLNARAGVTRVCLPLPMQL